MSWFIYHIVDSSGSPRYVGAAKNPYRRLLVHTADAVKHRGADYCGAKFQRWLCAEIDAGREFGVRCVLLATDADWRQVEMAEILRLLNAGDVLMNTQYEGGKRPAQSETMAKRSPEDRAWHAMMISKGHQQRKLRLSIPLPKPRRPRKP
jgi:hypothetical protein